MNVVIAEEDFLCYITTDNMASREVPRLPEEQPPEVVTSGSLGSQFRKYVHEDTRVPKGKEWAFLLIQKIPDVHKPLVTNFLSDLSFEERQKGAEHLSELIDNMGDRLRMSRYPEVEIGQCIDETRRWLKSEKERAEKTKAK
jgi:hypothetical protein